MELERDPTIRSGPDKPIHRLIDIGREQFDDLERSAQVAGGKFVQDTEQGPIELQIVTLPPQDASSSSFWQKALQKMGVGKSLQELPPVPVAIQPRISDRIPDQHPQLMALHPYVVLEDGTNCGVSISIPTALRGQWEDFEGPADDGLFSSVGKIEIGRRRRGIAFVARVDDGEPLIRQRVPTASLPVYQEMLSGGFKETQMEPGRASGQLTRRVTVNKMKTSHGIGEESEEKADEQALIFSVPPPGTIRGDREDKKGLVRVLVYQVVEKEVREIIERPLPQLLGTRGELDRFLGGESRMRGGGFSPGETTFGKERRTKVNVQGVKVEKPLAVFDLVLVGEKPEQGLHMVSQVVS